MTGNNKPDKEKESSFSENLIKALLPIDNDFNPAKEARRITLIYVALGIIWILIDQILNFISSKTETLMFILLIKDCIYITITGLILFKIIHTTLLRIHQDDIKMNQNYQELSATNEKLEASHKKLEASHEKLEAAHEELEAFHEELMASEEELRQQYDSLIVSQQQLLESEERYRLVSEATNDGIWDEQQSVRYFSERWFEITGYTRDEICNMEDWKILIHPDDYEETISIMNNHLQEQTPFYTCEYRLKASNGEYIWIQTRGKALFDHEGKAYRMAGSHADITALKESQNKLHYMAYHDSLTELPNRLALYEDNKIQLLLGANHKFAMLFLDADNFKIINDTLGHDIGDQLIKALGNRLKFLLWEGSNLYRLGGDEFVIVMNNITEQEDIREFATYVLTCFKEPFKVGNSSLYINISIGVAIYPEHGCDTNELLRCADVAMYKAKEAGGSRYMIYMNSMNQNMIERMEIEKNLHIALENNEFKLYYQPQYDILEKRITGFEALLRWNSKELGNISPLKFIKIAEDTRLIIPLGTWVLREACSFIRRLQDSGLKDITIAINISIIQILQNDFVEMVLELIERYNLEPENVELEITESVLMESYETIVYKLNQLYNNGFKIALDDFGKGYSSLSYLKQLPITTLKIDKSFIDCISSNHENKSLTGHIVKIGKSMGLNVVAEGVETLEQMDYLTLNNCQKIQGFLFSKPLPEEDIEKLIFDSCNNDFFEHIYS